MCETVAGSHALHRSQSLRDVPSLALPSALGYKRFRDVNAALGISLAPYSQ